MLLSSRASEDAVDTPTPIWQMGLSVSFHFSRCRHVWGYATLDRVDFLRVDFLEILDLLRLLLSITVVVLLDHDLRPCGLLR